ncbi:hypothetical protein SDC9_125479 [bioreactor metagenome]|uniref:Uncharacterized protein n=1 Tax=bioreactor metagenome TaxID=1076179 RepID=A0A645CNI2_9ZZZZ
MSEGNNPSLELSLPVTYWGLVSGSHLSLEGRWWKIDCFMVSAARRYYLNPANDMPIVYNSQQTIFYQVFLFRILISS